MKNILIVDDEKIERSGIIMLLKRMGMDVCIREASNGKEAFSYLQSVADKEADLPKIDILLTDVKMPFMDGITLIENVKNAGIKLKAIIFSGYNEFEYAKLAVKLGVQDYILKPVDPAEFAATIRKVCDELDEESRKNEDINRQESFIKQYYLYSLLNGGDAASILDNADYLDSYDRMALMEFNSEFFGKFDSTFAQDMIEEVSTSGEAADYLYLNLNTQQSVVLFNTNGRTEAQIVDIFKRLHDKVIEKTGQFMYAAISGAVSSHTELPGAMDELETLMNNKFYETETYIYTNSVSDKIPVLVQIDDDALMKQMKQDIKMKDVDFLRIHFDELCRKYRGQSNFSHIYIKFIFSNLLKDFYDNIPDAKEEEFGREIDKLYTSEDFSCIMEIVNNNIDLLEKTFAANPAMAHREIETVKSYIHSHYSEELGAQQLADMVYLAPSYLSSLFKKETGQNLSKYIKQYRMEKAKEMLEDTNMKIVNISEKVGYPNVSYFCQSFREYYGVSPQKFRDGM